MKKRISRIRSRCWTAPTISSLLGLAMFLCPVVRAGEPIAPVLTFLPDEMTAEGIGPACRPEHFVGHGLFDYMDGGAERYLALGFTDIAVRSYRKGAMKATVEIYSMGGPAEAYGIYAFSSKGEHPDVGAPATLSLGMLSLFRDKYYVRVVAVSDAPKAKELLVALGKKLASTLPGQAVLPAELKLLPEGAEDGSARFLPNPETARTVWFDGEGDVLLSGGGKAFTAMYLEAGKEPQCTRAGYPTAEAATKACEALAKKLELKPSSSKGQCTASGKLADDTFGSIEASGTVLRWVAGAASQDLAQAWLKKIQ